MQAEGRQQPSLARLSLLGLLIVLVDTASKLLAHQLPAAGVWLVPRVGFQLTENSGVAFGLTSGWLPLALSGLATLAILAWLWRTTKQPAADKIIIFAGVLIFSGALANILDRLVDRQIIDFIILGPWPAFNIADAAITVGVATIIARSLFNKN